MRPPGRFLKSKLSNFECSRVPSDKFRKSPGCIREKLRCYIFPKKYYRFKTSVFTIATCNILENYVKYFSKSRKKLGKRYKQSICFERVAIFCPKNQGCFFANKTIKYLFTSTLEL